MIYPGLQEPPPAPAAHRTVPGTQGVGAVVESGRKVGLGGHSPTVPAGSGFPGAAVLASGVRGEAAGAGPGLSPCRPVLCDNVLLVPAAQGL